MQQLANQLQRWLGNQGLRLVSLHCNGQPVSDGWLPPRIQRPIIEKETP